MKQTNNVFVKMAFACQAAVLTEPVSLVSPAGGQEGSSTILLSRRSRMVGDVVRAAPSPTTLHHSPHLPCKAQKCLLRQDLVL